MIAEKADQISLMLIKILALVFNWNLREGT